MSHPLFHLLQRTGSDLCVFCSSADTKCHSRDPKPTVLDPSDPKAKQTYVPKSETFEEYMKRRAGGGKNADSAAPAAASSSTAASVAAYSGQASKSRTYHLHLALVSCDSRTGSSSGASGSGGSRAGASSVSSGGRTSSSSAASAPRTRKSAYSLQLFP